MAWYWTVGLALLSLVLGYWFGTWRVFYEVKVKSHVDLLTPLLRVAYQEHARTPADWEAVNRSLARMWVLSSKKAAIAGDKVAQILAGNPGDFTAAAQKAIIALRKDAHPPVLRWFHRLKPSDVAHLQFDEGTAKE
jgi:hypothetical protein